MAIQTTLDNLRAKPEHVRKRIAFWSSLGVTLVIFAFWSASFSLSSTTVQGSMAAAVAETDTPGESLIAGVGNFFMDIKEMIFGAKKITYSEAIVTPGKK